MSTDSSDRKGNGKHKGIPLSRIDPENGPDREHPMKRPESWSAAIRNPPRNAFLRQHRRIALDTNVFIYQLERNTRYLPLTNKIFSWLDLPDSEAITSTITMTELLVQPLREGDGTRADSYHGLLSKHPNL